MMRLLLLLTLIATQSLGEVDSSGTYEGGEQSPSGDVSREAQSDGFLGTSASTGEEETSLSNSTNPLSGQSPANLNGSRRRSPGSPGAPPAPCMLHWVCRVENVLPSSVTDFNEYVSKCFAKKEFEIESASGQDVVFDLGKTDIIAVNYLTLMTKLKRVAIQMVGNSDVTKCDLTALTEWTGSNKDVVFEANTVLDRIEAKKLTSFFTVEKFVIRNNPVLTEVVFAGLTNMAAGSGVIILGNPSLDVLHANKDLDNSKMTVRGNKNLDGSDKWKGSAGSDVQTTIGDCYFPSPVKSLTELDGCTTVYEGLEFAANVTDSTSSKLTRIDGDLKIVGTDLADLNFFDFTSSPDGMLVGGTVSFSDNLGLDSRKYVFSKPCVVNNIGEAQGCPNNLELKGEGPNTVLDFSAMWEAVVGRSVAGGLFNKKKLTDISMRMINGSKLAEFDFRDLVEWTGASDEDSIFEGNTALTRINLEVLDTLTVKKLVIRNNPILKHIQLGPLKKMLIDEGFHLTKNPSLDAFITRGNDQTMSELTVRGNKLLEFKEWTGSPGSSIHEDMGECFFGEPVKSLTELDGCQEVYEDLEFAPNVTDSTRSKISRIDGNLKIVGTDLANLDFFDFKPTDGVEVTGAVTFSDNLGICGRDFVFSKQTHRTDCPTTPGPTVPPPTTKAAPGPTPRMRTVISRPKPPPEKWDLGPNPDIFYDYSPPDWEEEEWTWDTPSLTGLFVAICMGYAVKIIIFEIYPAYLDMQREDAEEEEASRLFLARKARWEAEQNQKEQNKGKDRKKK